ncbi:D-glycero-alpha-D-manno-heptose-1,7-bisphosphate 7-phosphatase [mine drainage metagenome]|uniref:D,D-heptose 1,7-bisphosphate phosphatase n=1 Tax=mine drainage metagenome TaxID=410659 RepID=A0A1J5QAM4_9ZZZZ
MSGSRALFLDRDGVINHDSGYTSSAENFRFIDGIFELCRAAKRSGYLLLVVTNQAGIARGYYSEQDFLTLTEWMLERFEEEGAPMTDVFHCPYHPEHGVGYYKKDSFDRKPNPGMLLRATEKYGFDLKRPIMIGDKDSDMQAASKAGVGVRCHYLADGHGILSGAATCKIHSLREGLSLLSESVTT